MLRRTFKDRVDAGKQLGQAVRDLLGTLPEPSQALVLALPRGGVPIGREVAQACAAPLDVLMVRKIGLPGHPELAAGAIVDGDTPHMVVNPDVLRMAGLSADDLSPIRDRELAELERRRKVYLADRPPIPVRDRTVIVVDDGIATGATVRAALLALNQKSPRRTILAVPVAPADSLADLECLVDHTVCLQTPFPFNAVGAHYRVFNQVSDNEVLQALSMQPDTDAP